MATVVYFYLLILILLGFGDVRFSFGGEGILTFSPFELWSYVVLLAFFVHLSLKGEKPAYAESPWLGWYVIWAFVTAAIFWGDGRMTLQMEVKKLVPAVAAYVLVSYFGRSRETFRPLAGTYLAVAAGSAMLGMLQYFRGGPYPIPVADIALEKLDLEGETAESLVTGFFSHPNNMAQYLAPLVVACAVGALFARGWRRCAACAGAGFFGFVLVLTNSKAALLWSLAGIGVALLSRTRFLATMKTVATAWSLLVAAIVGFAVVFVDQLDIQALKTLYGRTEALYAGGMLLMDHPLLALFGGGMRIWPEYSRDLTVLNYPDAHNFYLNEILMHGVVGCLLFLAFVVTSVRRGIRSPLQSGPAGPAACYIGAVFTATGIFFFEPAFQDSIQKFNFLVFVAALTIASSHSEVDGVMKGGQA